MQQPAVERAPEDVAMLGVFSPPSTKKRIRQAEKKRVYNRSWKSRMKTEIKKLLVAVEAEQVDVAKTQFPTAVSVIQRVRITLETLTEVVTIMKYEPMYPPSF